MNIKSLIEAFKNLDKIIAGAFNTLFKRRRVEAVAKKRMSICNKCELLDTEGSNCFVTGTQPCCSDCGCSLALKTRSLSSGCPKGKWEAVMTEEEEEQLNQ